MPVAVAEPEQVIETVRVELDVKFDFDKANVKPESQADIKALADFMNQYPQTTTVVEGHTDARGTDAYNQKLSERRANAVREVLVNQYGVEAPPPPPPPPPPPRLVDPDTVDTPGRSARRREAGLPLGLRAMLLTTPANVPPPAGRARRAIQTVASEAAVVSPSRGSK